MDEVESLTKRQYCTFELSGQLFGIDILDVKEISPEVEFTPIFHAKKYIKGYVNIRGQIHLVIDLGLLMGYEIKEHSEHSRIILFKPEVGDSFGVLVDKIGDVVSADESQIDDSYQDIDGMNETLMQKSAKMDGKVCILEDRLLIVLDARKFIEIISSRSK